MAAEPQIKPNVGASLAPLIVPTAVGISIILGFKFLMDGGKNNQDYRKDIVKSEKELDQLPVKTYSLTRDKAAYRLIADSVYTHLDDENHGGILNSFKYDEIYKALMPLNAEELREVAKQFGYRNATVFFWFKGSDQANIFTWFEGVLDTKQQLQMRKLWQKSGLWGNSLTEGQKNTILQARRKLFQYTDTGLRVYPGYCKIPLHQYDKAGTFQLIANLTITNFWQLGLVTAVTGKNKDTGTWDWVKVKISNAAYPQQLGVEFWICTVFLNKEQPPQDDPINFPLENKKYTV